MKPILYEANSTSFDGMGLGVLSDCISCLVTEERNGVFEVEFEYPITGVHFAEITKGRIVRTSHDEKKNLQPFVIYRISKPISGVCLIYAHHISYDLNNTIVEPYSASNIGTALDGFHDHAITNNSFTFWTDKTSSGTFEVKIPASVRSLLGGKEGSILDAFGGGEYEFDNYTVKLYQHRGYDNGVTISYGKNLTDIEEDVDAMGLYNSAVPYWTDGASVVVYGDIVAGDGGIEQIVSWDDENGIPIQDENGSVFEFRQSISKVVAMDLSSEFEEAPTVAQLEARAATVLNTNTPWIPKTNIKIDFVALWQTEEYKNIAPLERVSLCDTVHVKYAELGVEATAKVITTVWNPLLERYDSIELGDAKTSFADTLMSETDYLIDQKIKDIPSWSDMDLAIMNATNLITGGMGGHIVFLYDANQHPTDMLVMDTADVTTAAHVLRINVNGMGFSSNGINGPYTSAWTLNGVFNADFIVAGTMSAARIHGGTLVLGGQNNGNGAITVYDGSGNVIGRWNNAGIEINQGTFRTYDGVRTTAIEAGYSKYYRGTPSSGTYIGNIGADDHIYSDWGLSMTVMYEGEGIGWYASTNTSDTMFEPILMYYKGAWIDSDHYAVEDGISVNRDMHIASGYSLYHSDLDGCTLDDCTIIDSRIQDPVWKMSGTNYNGITRTTPHFVLPMGFDSTGKATGWWDAQLTFVHGILVDSTLP